MSPVYGSNDALIGHVVDCYGNLHRTWSGDLGGFMGACSIQMGKFYLTNYEDPDFADREEA